MKVIDPGHKYKLLSLDGEINQTLTFVKRKGLKFPGNKNKYPGTTLQDVVHCLLNRIRFLQNQIPCIENEIILKNLQECLFLLESRAANLHHIPFNPKNLEELEMRKLCNKCGHTKCNCDYE